MHGNRVHDHKSEKHVLINESCDVSGSKEGVCIVTRTIFLSNTHAGTHCDQPGHFVRNPTVRFYHDSQYNGACRIVDLSSQLSQTPKTITVEILEKVLSGIDLNHVTRLLFCTRTAILDQWSNDFAHFNKASAAWLGDHLPNLVLVAIDTPSVDASTVAPIIDYAHGQFWNARIALAENITFEKVKLIPQEMYLQTIWNPLQEAEDARGCSMYLYPHILQK
jgi:kynurenine formamidase